MPSDLTDYPYIPLTKFKDFLHKLEEVGVEKLEFTMSKMYMGKTICYLKRKHKGKEYTVPIHPSIKDDSLLTVATMDNILNRLKINGKDIGFDYMRL